MKTNLEEHIDSWLTAGIISSEQADQMLLLSGTIDKDTSSNKFVTIISILGSIFLGIGVIWFMASNWAIMGSITKVILLLGSTTGLLYIGNEIGYNRANYPIVGKALVFLSAIMFGASIFLIGQIFNVNANSSSLLFLWFIGIIPLVYIYQSPLVTLLSSIVFWIWYNYFLIGTVSEDNVMNGIYFNQIFGVILFAIGSLHYDSHNYKRVARAYRLFGILITIITLFIFTFKWLYSSEMQSELVTQVNVNWMIIIGIWAITSFLLFLNLKYNPSRSETNKIENGIAFGILTLFLIFDYLVFTGTSSYLFLILFNLVFVGLIVVLFKVGYQRRDMKLINMASAATFFYVIFKFLDIFSDLLVNGLTWIVFGILLIVAATFLEKKRRTIRQTFLENTNH